MFVLHVYYLQLFLCDICDCLKIILPKCIQKTSKRGTVTKKSKISSNNSKKRISKSLKTLFVDLSQTRPINFRLPGDGFKYYKPIEMKKILGVPAVHYKMSTSMVGRLRKSFTLNRLKRLKIFSILNIYLIYLILNIQSCFHIKNSRLKCRANRLPGFCLMASLDIKRLRKTILNISRLSNVLGIQSLYSVLTVFMMKINVLANFT